MCIIISLPKNNFPLCDIFLYRKKKSCPNKLIPVLHSKQFRSVPPSLSFHFFFRPAFHNNFSWWHFKNQLTNSLPQFPKDLLTLQYYSLKIVMKKKMSRQFVKKKNLNLKNHCHIPHLFLNWLCLNQVFKYLVIE